MEYSIELASIVEAYLTQAGRKFEFDNSKGLFRMRCPLEGPLKHSDIVIRIYKHAIAIFAYSPLYANVNRRHAVAEFLTRANYGISGVNFEMDFNDGQIRCKSYIDCEDQLPINKSIEKALTFPLFTLDRYGKELIAVLHGKAEPKEACQRAERPNNQ